jgi:hypothetical protein
MDTWSTVSPKTRENKKEESYKSIVSAILLRFLSPTYLRLQIESGMYVIREATSADQSHKYSSATLKP